VTSNPFFERKIVTEFERELSKLIEHHLVDANKMVAAGARS